MYKTKEEMDKFIDRVVKIMRSGDLAGSFAEGCDCEKCDKYEKKIRNKLRNIKII